MKNRETFETSLQEDICDRFFCFFRREERASAKVLRDYVTRIKLVLVKKGGVYHSLVRRPWCRWFILNKLLSQKK